MKQKGGTVYFFQIEGNGPVKIGYTAYPPTRFAGLQGWCPYKLAVLAAAPAPSRLEPYCLLLVQEDQIRGEWFHPTARVLALADEVRRTGTVAGLPDACPSYGVASVTFDQLIPRIWPDLETMADALALTVPTVRHMRASHISDVGLCRIVIAARDRGFNITTADLHGPLRARPAYKKRKDTKDYVRVKVRQSPRQFIRFVPKSPDHRPTP